MEPLKPKSYIQSIVIAGLCLITPAVFSSPLFKVNIDTGMGSTQGTLQWNIAGGSDGPNILSELTYKNLEFSEIYGSGSIAFQQGSLKDMEFFVSYRSGTAKSGEVQDSDYHSDNRSDEYSRSYSSAKDSTMSDISVGIARSFRINAYNSIAPMFAVTSKKQNLVMTQGEQVLDTRNPNNTGPFRGTLDSRYNTQWLALSTGMKWVLQSRYHQLSLAGKLYWLDYYSNADWNLRSDFAHPKSFEQWANGTGIGIEVSYRYQMSDLLSLWVNWSLEDWSTQAGEDIVYYADGSSGSTQLNEVSWKSSGIITGLVVKF